MVQDSRIGTEIAGFRVQRLIGRGGMSVVYLAEHVGLRRKVALKLLAPELAREPEFRNRFIRESRLAASIDHPNIVPIYDAGEAGELLYIAMRYVEGTDRKVLIRTGGPLEPRTAVSVVGQVAGALDAAHGRGLVHSDVKPSNILIASGLRMGSGDHAYLADFGLTKQALSVSGGTTSGQFIGTIDYCAPEQIRGEPVGSRADVYSLGAVLYECLAGRPPYEADSEVAVLWGHVQGKPPSAVKYRPELPTGIDRVIAKAMAKSPPDRYAKCSQLAADARSELGIGEAEVPPILVRGPGRRQRRRRALLPAVAGLVAIGVAMLLLRVLQHAFPVASDTVAVIDPSSNKVVNGQWVGRDPRSIAYDPASGVWEVNTYDRTVGRVDPRTMVARPPISPVGPPSDIAAGLGAVWVTSQSRGKVSVIDPRINRVVDTLNIAGASSVAIGSDAVWVTSSLDDAV